MKIQGQANTAVSKMNITEEQSATMEEVERITNMLSDKVNELSFEIAKFKI